MPSRKVISKIGALIDDQLRNNNMTPEQAEVARKANLGPPEVRIRGRRKEDPRMRELRESRIYARMRESPPEEPGGNPPPEEPGGNPLDREVARKAIRRPKRIDELSPSHPRSWEAWREAASELLGVPVLPDEAAAYDDFLAGESPRGHAAAVAGWPVYGR